MTRWMLSGFGDEIDPQPDVQVAVLKALGAHHIEVRSAWGTNVVELGADDLERLAAIIDAASMGVSAIASPVGKADAAVDMDDELARLRRAIVAAHRLQCRYIRVFSFFHDGREPAAVRDEVLARMSAMASVAEQEGVILLHENEKEIYGDVPERILDLVEAVGSTALRLAWDSANFVQVGVRPYADAFSALLAHIEYLQVKDALFSTGEVVPAGEGDGDIARIVEALRDVGYGGFASLEPHLADAHVLGGFSGPTAFGEAARAFRRIAEASGVELV